MKKFVAIIVFAGVLVACNNETSSETSTDSTTIITTDTNTMSIPITTDTTQN